MTKENKELLSRLNIDENNISKVERIVLDSDISIENKEQILRVGLMEAEPAPTELQFLKLISNPKISKKINKAGFAITPVMYDADTFEPEIRVIAQKDPRKVYRVSLTLIKNK